MKDRKPRIRIKYTLTVCKICGRIIGKNKGICGAVWLDYCSKNCEELGAK